jgi:hypothetical protein
MFVTHVQHVRNLARNVLEFRQYKLQTDSYNSLQAILQSNETNEKTQSTLRMM